MTKQEKINLLPQLMTQKTRDDGTKFYCFTNKAPEEIKDIYFENYEVRDLDYQIFSEACDTVSDIYLQKQEGDFEDQIYENEFASYMTGERLSYLNIWNEEEIGHHIMTRINISTACAIWYDDQVRSACRIINEWIQII